MDFTNKLSLILESILLQDGEYTIEDDQPETKDPDGLPDEDKFGEDTKTYYLKKNNNILTTIKIGINGIIIDNKEYETHPTIQKFLNQDPKCAYLYARDVLRSRFPLGEPAISQNPKYAYWYALGVLRSRFPLGEKTISQDPKCAYGYARFVLKSRFPLGEKTISQDPEWAYGYARFVLKSRFLEAEETIKKYEYWWNEYKDALKYNPSRH